MDFTGDSSKPPAYGQDEPVPSSSRNETEGENGKRRPIHSTSAEGDPADLPPPYKPPTFTTDGINITFEDGDFLYPQYRLTRNVFELRPGPSITIERLIYTGDSASEDDSSDSSSPSSSGTSTPTRRTVKQLYHITTTDVSRRHSYTELLQGQAGNSGQRPWRVSERGPQQFLLEARHKIGLSHPELMSGPDTGRRIRWADPKAGLVAVEHRAVHARSKEMQQQPRLEILGEADDDKVGFLLAVWVARLRQEAIYSHRGHLSVQLSKSWIRML